MKKHFVFFLLVVFGIFLLNSCNKEYVQTFIAYQSNGADFAVTNLRTNVTVKNKGVSVSMFDTLVVNRSDSLLLVYKAPQKYAESKFSIKFSMFGDEYSSTNVSGSQPYEYVGVVKPSLADSNYLIQCTAVSDEWLEGSYDKGYVMVELKE